MAINGHTTSKEVTRYTRVARQKVRAESALKRLTRVTEPGQKCPIFRIFGVRWDTFYL
jgi:hypothetical protein